MVCQRQGILIDRYSRQIIFPGIGEEGQRKPGNFDEDDIRSELPMVVAAERHLRKVNSSLEIEGIVDDVNFTNIDLVALSGHKGLFGPLGTGVLFIGGRVDLDPLGEGGTGSYSEQEKQPITLPDRYERGTLNTVGISGLGAGLTYILSEGLEGIRSHEQRGN